MAAEGWEHFEHGADIGVRGFGPTKAAAFEQASLALTAVMSDPDTIRPLAEVNISCTAPDDELLLADWLNAVVYEMATRGMLFGRFSVVFQDRGLEDRVLRDRRLQGAAWGEPVDPDIHDPAVEVKGATYTALRVAPTNNGGWMAQCVVDV